MRLVHLTDLHITEGKRLEEHRRILNGVVDTALGLSPDVWLLTGDFYGHTVPHRSTPAERAVLFAAVARMADVAPVVVVYGNHDYPGDLEPLATLGGELGWPVKVVAAGGEVTTPTPCGATFHGYALPYPRSTWVLRGEEVPRSSAEADQLAADHLGNALRLWGSIVKARRLADPTAAHVLLAHANVAGSRTAGGEVMSGREIDIAVADIEAGRFDYGALGHIHLRQEVALRCWYAGTPWRNDYAETDPKGWHLIDLGDEATKPGPRCKWPVRPLAESTTRYAGDERLPCAVRWVHTDPRARVTLRYRWAADEDTGAPRWMDRPDLDTVELTNAEVRALLVVPSQWAATCPWEEEIAELTRRGAFDIEAARTVEPSMRVRAPSVAAAVTDEEAVIAYWGVLGTELQPTEREAALACLAELRSTSDAEVMATTQLLIAGSAVPSMEAAP